MEPINILLIDDDPVFCMVSIEDAINLGYIQDGKFTKEQLAKKIPVLHNTAPREETQWKEFHKYFKLQWLQSPLDVKEFNTLSTEIETRLTPKTLGNFGYVPDIVCSDYALTDKMDFSYYDTPNDNNILSLINPNYILTSFFQKILKEEKKLHRDLSGQSQNYEVEYSPNKDNMGCYAGGITAFRFRNHPCSIIPTTFKTKEKVQGKDAGYFEWLLEDEFDSAYDWQDRGTDKAWHNIIKHGVYQLRKRIEKQTLSQQISPDILAVLNLAADGGANNKERAIVFHSAYGRKEMPLDGLFIDELPENRTKAIKAWCQGLLNTLLKQKNYSLSGSDNLLMSAFSMSKKLWEEYKNTKQVIDRLKLSELHYLLSLGDKDLARKLKFKEPLDRSFIEKKESLESEYKSLSQKFGVNKGEVKHNYDMRSGNFSKDERRLGVLITMLRLHHHFVTYSQNPDELMSSYLGANMEPDEDDYYLALYPNASTPITTRFHASDAQNFKNALKRQTTLTGDEKEGLEIRSILEKDGTSNDIQPGERYLLNCIAQNEELFPYYQDKKNLPKWIKIY